MQFTLTDFLIGLFLANAIPHLLMWQTRSRFLSLFGFTPVANLLYSIWNVALAGGIFLWAYGPKSLLQNGLFLGVFALFAMYLLTGRAFYSRWNSTS